MFGAEWDRSQAIAGLVDGMTTTKGETKEATRRDGRKRVQKESRKESGEECETIRILLLCCSLFVVRLGGRSKVGEVESLGERAGGLEEAGI